MAYKLSALEGNRQKLDGGAMFGNAPRALWSRWLEPDSLNRIELACRCLLIEGPELRILCETGIGAFFEPKLAERYGVEEPERHLLLDNLASLGIDEGMIDYVILSHLHFDHAGGLLPSYAEIQKKGPRLLFPKARYVVSTAAWQRALSPHPRDKASFIPGMPKLLRESQRLMLITGEQADTIADGRLQFRLSQGHTPGHLHTLFQGESGSVFFCGDLVPGTAWLNEAITMGYDRYPELLIDEKTQLLTEACEQQWWLFYTHDPLTSLSLCQRNAQGKLEAVTAKQSLRRQNF